MVLPTTSVTRRVLLQNQYLTLAKESLVYTATLHYKEDNPLNTSLILATKSAYDEARKDIGQDYSKDGAAFILTGQGHSVFSSGVPFDEETRGSNILRDAYGPLLLTILTFPFPTICSINGLCEGGANIIALCHDYRILDGQAGVMSFDAIHLGAHFVGIAGIIRHKLTPQAARKMALEGYRFSAQDALADGVVDKLAASDKQEETAITLAREVAPLGKHGSYGLMRKELLGDVVQKLLWSCQ